MSGIGPDQRTGYSLIPQLNSDDSDLSEEELHSLYQDGFQIITKKHFYSPDIAKRLMKDTNSEMRSLSTEINSEKCNEPERPFPLHRNDASKARESDRMTLERKVLFFLSIFLCFFVIGLFLSLPCSWDNCSHYMPKNNTEEMLQKTMLTVRACL